LLTLTRLIGNFPESDKPEERKTLIIGKSLSYVSIDKIRDFITVAQTRVNLDIQSADFENIAINSNKKIIDDLKHPNV